MNDFDENNQLKSTTEENTNNSENAYTVLPQSSFYTKQREDIIQDDLSYVEKSKSSFYENNSRNTAPNSNTTQQSKTPPIYKTAEKYDKKSNYSFYDNSSKSQKGKKRYSFAIVILSCFLAAVIGAVSGVASMIMLGKVSVSEEVKNPNNINISIDETAESVVEAVAEKVTPSVVGIRTTTSVMSFFGATSESSGEGSGVVYSSDGYIITNYHVISEATTYSSDSKIEVFLDSGNSDAYTATVVGYNISADLAVIKINATGLTAIEVADSETLKVGHYVITIGNPGGLEFMDSVTYGVISGLNRVVSSDTGIELIQTDAAINPGNSGGALVNVKGKLVGINSSKIVSEEFEGMGFAIPSNTVKKICDNIISKEDSPEPYIGISISERYTSDILKYYGFPNGAVVLSVVEKSPAYAAGIRRGDIITEYNETKITEYQVLQDLINDSEPGQKITVKLYRSSKYYTTEITVGSNN